MLPEYIYNLISSFSSLFYNEPKQKEFKKPDGYKNIYASEIRIYKTV